MPRGVVPDLQAIRVHGIHLPIGQIPVLARLESVEVANIDRAAKTQLLENRRDDRRMARGGIVKRQDHQLVGNRPAQHPRRIDRRIPLAHSQRKRPRKNNHHQRERERLRVVIHIWERAEQSDYRPIFMAGEANEFPSPVDAFSNGVPIKSAPAALTNPRIQRANDLG